MASLGMTTRQVAVSGIAATSLLYSEIRFRRLRWLGHVACVPDDRLPDQVLFGQLAGPGVKGRPRDSWRTVVHKDLSALKVEMRWYELVQNRQAWRQLIATTHLART